MLVLGSPTCTPVSSGGLAATIILTVFPPVMLVCCWATLDCAKENDIDVGGVRTAVAARCGCYGASPSRTLPCNPRQAASACAKRVHERRTPERDAPMRSMSGRRRGSRTTVGTNSRIELHNRHAGDPKLRSAQSATAVKRSTSLEMVTVDNNNRTADKDAKADSGRARADSATSSEHSLVARTDSLGKDQWRCALCSFKNSNMMPVCEQCDMPKT